MIDDLECAFEGVIIDVRDLPLTISLEGDSPFGIKYLHRSGAENEANFD